MSVDGVKLGCTTLPLMEGRAPFERRLTHRRLIQAIRAGPFAGRWPFAWIFLAQLGHLVEHIAKALTGSAFFGASFDNDVSHLVFNGAIALLAVTLVAIYPRNPWVYPLALLCVFHAADHIFIVAEFIRTGVEGRPGLFGLGGALGLIPVPTNDIHNLYNGVEMILIVLGLWNEVEAALEAEMRT